MFGSRLTTIHDQTRHTAAHGLVMGAGTPCLAVGHSPWRCQLTITGDGELNDPERAALAADAAKFEMAKQQSENPEVIQQLVQHGRTGRNRFQPKPPPEQ